MEDSRIFAEQRLRNPDANQLAECFLSFGKRTKWDDDDWNFISSCWKYHQNGLERRRDQKRKRSKKSDGKPEKGKSSQWREYRRQQLIG